MSFIQNMYEYKKVFRDIEKLSKKCLHLKCDIDFNETCLNNGVSLNIPVYIWVNWGSMFSFIQVLLNRIAIPALMFYFLYI